MLLFLRSHLIPAAYVHFLVLQRRVQQAITLSGVSTYMRLGNILAVLQFHVHNANPATGVRQGAREKPTSWHYGTCAQTSVTGVLLCRVHRLLHVSVARNA